MSNDSKAERSQADAEIEKEIRLRRKFTIEEAIGRLAGPGAMKGESPVTRMQQAGFEIDSWLSREMIDSAGSLRTALARDVLASEQLLNSFEHPLAVLADYCQQVLDSDYLLEELVRTADSEWGRIMGERPYFERKGSSPHPDDPYTLASVRSTLNGLLQQLMRK